MGSGRGEKAARDGRTRRSVGADGGGDVGATVRALRQRHQLTASGLAARAGITAGAVSQIESGRILPSITTLRNIAQALDEPVFRFFLPTDGERGVVVRRGERKLLSLPTYTARYELLSPDLGGRLEVLELHLGPGKETADEPRPHPGEECMVVLRGRARLEIDGSTYVLSAGDAATYPGDLPHRVVNVGRGELVAISAITPPSF